MIKNAIPDLYLNLLPKEILKVSIFESRATCNNCLMAPHKYKPHLKCCTFEPFIPNYLLGEMIFQNRFKNSQSLLLPIGAVPRIDYQVEFNSNKKKIFGQDEAFLCPYYDKQQNQCSIWRYRGSVCSAFYCKSSYGRAGKNFWKAWGDYMAYVEMALSQEVLVQLGFSPKDLDESLKYLNLKKKINLPPALIWCGYESRELYLKAREIVRELRSIKEILSAQGEGLEKLVIEKFEKLESRKLELSEIEM